MEKPLKKEKYVLRWDFDFSAQDGYIHTRSFPISLGDEKEFSKIKRERIPIIILPEGYERKAIVAISREKYPGEMNSIVKDSINKGLLQKIKREHLLLSGKEIVGFSYLYKDILKVIKFPKGQKLNIRKGVKIQLYSTNKPYIYILEILDKGLNEWRGYRQCEITELISKERTDKEEEKVINSLMKLSQKEILKKIKTNSPKLQKRKVCTKQFVRDLKIMAFALKRSKGHCELCGNKAPFLKDDDLYYLEVHHIKPLSKKGYDSINNVAALCPNCHRLLHHGKERHKKTKFLLKKFSKIEN